MKALHVRFASFCFRLRVVTTNILVSGLVTVPHPSSIAWGRGSEQEFGGLPKAPNALIKHLVSRSGSKASVSRSQWGPRGEAPSARQFLQFFL